MVLRCARIAELSPDIWLADSAPGRDIVGMSPTRLCISPDIRIGIVASCVRICWSWPMRSADRAAPLPGCSSLMPAGNRSARGRVPN